MIPSSYHRKSLLTFLVLTFLAALTLADIPTTVAVVVLTGTSGVNGTVIFAQPSLGSPVTITGSIHGLAQNALRGLHVHQYGNLTEGCVSAGSHFNPDGNHHGGPTDTDRHVGDLGNIQSDGNGVANLNFSDQVISLNGPHSIIGRAIVVHNGTDDLGRGNNSDSLVTGNAGGRAACGVIGIALP